MIFNNQYSQFTQHQMGFNSQIQHQGYQQQQNGQSFFNGFVNQQSHKGQANQIYNPKPISNSSTFIQNQLVKPSSPNQFNQFSCFSSNNQDQYSENSTSCGSDEHQDDFLDQMPQIQQNLFTKPNSLPSPVLNGSNNQQQLPLLNSINQQKAKVNPIIPEEAKYKTEMCKNWVETGKCNYGDKCKFAHGKNQLVQKVAANKHFKTKKCKQYFETCICNYGPRCHFVHDIRSIEEIQQTNLYSKKLINPEFFLELSSSLSSPQSSETSQSSRRLDIFQKLTTSSQNSIYQ